MRPASVARATAPRADRDYHVGRFESIYDGARRGQVKLLRCLRCTFTVMVGELHRAGDRSGLGRYNRARAKMVEHIYACHRDHLAPLPAGRRFLTRPEATCRLGLMDASLRREPAGVRVAVRNRATGEIHEALPDEALHAQIRLRTGTAGAIGEDGWTVPAGATTP